jgi:hypothetical protein
LVIILDTQTIVAGISDSIFVQILLIWIWDFLAVVYRVKSSIPIFIMSLLKIGLLVADISCSIFVLIHLVRIIEFAVITFVSDSVFIGIYLIRVWSCHTVVYAVKNPVRILVKFTSISYIIYIYVFLVWIENSRTVIKFSYKRIFVIIHAGISQSISVRIPLVWIKDIFTIIHTVANSILVIIGIKRIFG